VFGGLAPVPSEPHYICLFLTDEPTNASHTRWRFRLQFRPKEEVGLVRTQGVGTFQPSCETLRQGGESSTERVRGRV